MLHLIGFIITGFIVGLLARALKPGDDSMGLGMTTLMGVTGALLAGWLGRFIGWYRADEGVGFFMSTIGAVLAIAIYYGVSGRGRHFHH